MDGVRFPRLSQASTGTNAGEEAKGEEEAGTEDETGWEGNEPNRRYIGPYTFPFMQEESVYKL